MKSQKIHYINFGIKLVIHLHLPKKILLLEDTDHLNFKFEINAKNTSKEKKDFFESSNLIHDSPNEVAVPKDVKTILGRESKKLKKLVKDIDLTTISLIYENFLFHDLENYICKAYVTEIEKSFSLYGLISFSGKAIKDKAVSLILLQNKLNFNVERDILKKKLSFKLEKLNEKTRIVTSRDDILNFGILCTQKK